MNHPTGQILKPCSWFPQTGLNRLLFTFRFPAISQDLLDNPLTLLSRRVFIDTLPPPYVNHWNSVHPACALRSSVAARPA